jgi:glutamate racemase
MTSAPIGLFDSGIGGLSILRQVRQTLPGHDLIYLADQAHVPYGPRPMEEIRDFSESITRFLLDQGARLVVVACNTASAAALKHLRETFPQVPLVGMEPAVKPAAQITTSGVVGVLATPATFQGELYASVVERFGQDVRVINQTVPGLVECVEAGDLDGPAPRRLLQAAIEPLLEQGIDTLVLACTHYPFVIPLISEIAGPGVRVIDPSPAIARQVERVLGEVQEAQSGRLRLLTSADPLAFQESARRLIGVGGEAELAIWTGGSLALAPG